MSRASHRERISQAEYEIHGALDEAVLEILAAGDVTAQVIRQETVIALDQVFGERTEEQGVLGGSEPAVLHVKIIRVDSQGDLLPFCLRVQRIVHDSQVLHGDMVRADRHGPGPEGVVFLPVCMNFIRVVVPDDAGFVHVNGKPVSEDFYIDDYIL